MSINDHVKIDLFFVIDGIGCEVVVNNILLFAEFHSLDDVSEVVSFFKEKEKVDISMNLFFREGDVGFYKLAQRRNHL